MPVMPTMNQMQSSINNDHMQSTSSINGHKATVGFVVGSPSTKLLQVGSKKTKQSIKKKFDLNNARSRDPFVAMSHSYKSK